jgi:hypothetical protein
LVDYLGCRQLGRFPTQRHELSIIEAEDFFGLVCGPIASLKLHAGGNRRLIGRYS